MSTRADIIVNGRGFFIQHGGHPAGVVPAVVEMWEDARRNPDKLLLAFYEDTGGFIAGSVGDAWKYYIKAEAGARLYITIKYVGKPLFDNRPLAELEHNLLADGSDGFIKEELERMGL